MDKWFLVQHYQVSCADKGVRNKPLRLFKFSERFLRHFWQVHHVFDPRRDFWYP